MITCGSGIGCGYVEAGAAGGDVVRVVEVVETQGAGHDLWWEQRQDLDEDQAGEQDGCGGEHCCLELGTAMLEFTVRDCWGEKRDGIVKKGTIRIPMIFLFQDEGDDHVDDQVTGEWYNCIPLEKRCNEGS